MNFLELSPDPGRPRSGYGSGCCLDAEYRVGNWTDCAGKAASVGTGFQKRYRAQGNPGG